MPSLQILLKWKEVNPFSKQILTFTWIICPGLPKTYKHAVVNLEQRNIQSKKKITSLIYKVSSSVYKSFRQSSSCKLKRLEWNTINRQIFVYAVSVYVNERVPIHFNFWEQLHGWKSVHCYLVIYTAQADHHSVKTRATQLTNFTHVSWSEMTGKILLPSRVSVTFTTSTQSAIKDLGKQDAIHNTHTSNLLLHTDVWHKQCVKKKKKFTLDTLLDSGWHCCIQFQCFVGVSCELSHISDIFNYNRYVSLRLP